MSTSDYLQQRILTASPPQLHLMLIEGAIRFAERADRLLAEEQLDEADPLLRKAIDVAAELLASVKHSDDEINVKLASLYNFVFTRLTMALVNSDRQLLAEAVEVLHFERETWRQACEIAHSETHAPNQPAKGPHKPAPLADTDLTTEGGGFTLEV